MDEAILGWFTDERNEGLLDAAHAITFAGNTIVLLAVAIVGTLVLLRSEAYRAAAFYLIACLSSVGLNFGLKYLIDRPRPTSYFAPGMTEITPSFPSGHALMSTVIYGGFAWLAYRRNPVVLGLVGIAIVLIGLSRLVLGVHYPSDVFTGWVIGVWVVVSLKAVYNPRRVSRPVGPGS
ncbi:MAG: phosphatase PAP2 family protein [Planctomycetota bacterium]|nr:phosphatase PAP2 family protein [Planctomycetota bacterium]